MTAPRGDGSRPILRSDGRYVAAIWVLTPAGVRRRRFVYARSFDACVDKVRALRKANADGVAVGPARLTIAAFVTDWLTTIERNVRPATLTSYRQIVEQHIVPGLGHVRLTALQPGQVERWLAHLEGRNGSRLSPRRIQMAQAVLRVALASAVRQGLVPRNVAAIARGPKVEHRELRVWTADEAARFLAATRDDRHGPLWTTLLGTGLRIGEALGLRWSDVDLDAAVLHVRQGLARDAAGAWSPSPPKTAQGRRTVPLGPSIIHALERQRAGQRKAAIVTPIVFASLDGGHLDPGNVRRAFAVAVEAASVPRVRLHDLRHGFATAAIAAGLDLRSLAAVLGHADPVMVLRTYGHPDPEATVAAIGRLDALLGAG